MNRHVLVLNTGSSSIKFTLFESKKLKPLATGKIERIGLKSGKFQCIIKNETVQFHKTFSNHQEGLSAVFQLLETKGLKSSETLVGHRIVQGGKNHRSPEKITPSLIKDLKKLIPLAPLHLPPSLEAIQAVSKFSSDIPQAACYDTAFHQTIPLKTKQFPLPDHLYREGIMRYGFHGLSYESIVFQLKKMKKLKKLVVIAHLGNGASLAAVLEGKSIDTSMGLTPLGGIMMSSRSGDLDPGILLYLIENKGYTIDAIKKLVTSQAGFIGVSNISTDVRDLLVVENENEKASLALEMFCYQVRKWIGSYAAALGGIEQLVFTGGIGENSPEIRERVCAPLKFLGISIHSKHNNQNSTCISSGKVEVLVIPTDEEQIIARHTKQILTR